MKQETIATTQAVGITELQIIVISEALNVSVIPLRQGILDGYEQGFELSVGMSYDDLGNQWAYDTGTYLGACIAVREAT